MNDTQTKVTHDYKWVRFKSLRDMTDAIYIYAGLGDRDALKNDQNHISRQHGNMAGDLLSLVLNDPDRIRAWTDELVASLNQSLKASPLGIGFKKSFRANYEYAPGIYHKQSITAVKDSFNKYYLSFSRNSSTDYPTDKKIADMTGGDVGYTGTRVEKTYAPQDDGLIHIPVRDVRAVFESCATPFNGEDALTQLFDRFAKIKVGDYGTGEVKMYASCNFWDVRKKYEQNPVLTTKQEIIAPPHLDSYTEKGGITLIYNIVPTKGDIFDRKRESDAQQITSALAPAPSVSR